MGTVKYSGPVASFHCPTNAEIRSLKVHFSPKQLGSGTPSPENVREIEGWDGVTVHQSQKNLMHLLGYSAVNHTTTSQSRKLTNDYGTTINTIDPEKSVTITQTLWPATSKASYQNGYFVVMEDNLKFEERYDISFRVTNITNNPLNATLSDLVIYSPTGHSVSSTRIIDGDRITFKNAMYDQNTATPLRHGFDVRICGMSCTISDFIVTAINTEDKTYESYHGSTLNYEFGVLGKNKVPWISPDSFTKENAYNGNAGWSTLWAVPKNANGVKITYSADIDNTNGAGSAFLHIWTKDENDNFVDMSITSSSLGIGSSGRLSKTITLNTDRYSYVIFGLTMNNATASHPMVEIGDTATTYEPYDPNKTVYGGYVDIITGEVSEQWESVDLDTLTWTYNEPNSAFYTSSIMYQILKNGVDMYCNVYPTVNKYVDQINENAISSANSYGSGKIFIKNLDYTTVEDFVVSLNGAKLVFPLRKTAYNAYQLPPSSMQTFLAQNNVWSNADYVEVEYDLHETQSILARKQFIVANQPHIVKPAAAPLQNFVTDMAAPLKECKVYFGPVQEGTGDPSPENVREISGWTGVEVTRCGKNLIDESYLANANNYVNVGGYGYVYTNDIQLAPNTRYRFVWYDYDSTALSEFGVTNIHLYVTGASEYIINNAKYQQYNSGFVTPSTGIIRFGIYYPSSLQRQDVLNAIFNNGKLMLQVGTDDIAYELYSGTTLPIDWTTEAGAVYGGYVDLVKGELVKTYFYLSLGTIDPVYYGASSYDGTLGTNAMYYITDTGLTYDSGYANKVFADKVKWAGRGTWSTPNNFIWQYCINAYNQLHVVFDNDTVGITSDMNFATRRGTIKTWLQSNPMYFALPYKTPISYTLTPTQLKTLRGTNNIWSNANGNIELSYWKH